MKSLEGIGKKLAIVYKTRLGEKIESLGDDDIDDVLGDKILWDEGIWIEVAQLAYKEFSEVL